MKIHFIAIGGSAMHNLAIALHRKGYDVSGSDDAIFEPSKTRLQNNGILPEALGWFPEKITKDLQAVILGMHAKEDNPELLKAKELGLKIYSYPEYLYEQSKDKTRVVIGGSHGKTTITSMILHVMNFHQKPIDFMVGAQLEGFDNMVKITKENEFMILEGDEYLSSPIDRRPKFLLYQPNIALISGIAWDHINVFPTFDNYVNQFQLFANSISQGGALIYNEEDTEVKKVAENTTQYLKKFPYKTPIYRIENNKTILETELGDITLQIFGAHNLLNLEGARNICNLLQITDEQFYEAIQTFKGASKRLELVKANNQYTVFKDFAHSPSKVQATLNAVKNQFKDKKTVACLELHTYSSLTPEFLKEYKNTLYNADVAIVYYNEEALKIKRMQPIAAQDIKDYFNNQAILVFTESETLEKYLKDTNKADSVFLMMSSGNYGGIDLNTIF